MFDIGFTEMLLIGVVALVVIGPERLPGVARTAGKYFTRLKRFMTNVKADVESELRADELREILSQQQKELDSLKSAVTDVGKDLDIESTLKEPSGKAWTESLQTPSSDDLNSGHSGDDLPEPVAQSPEKPVKKTRKAAASKPRKAPARKAKKVPADRSVKAPAKRSVKAPAKDKSA